MPVIECACGMVMSIASDDSRCYCIRCGGLEFRVVSEVISTVRKGRSVESHAAIDSSAMTSLLAATCAPLVVSASEACQS